MVKITIYTQKCEQKCPGWKKNRKYNNRRGGTIIRDLRVLIQQNYVTRLKKRVKCKVTSKSNKQQVKCIENEQKIKRNGKKVPCNKQKVTSKEQQANEFQLF